MSFDATLKMDLLHNLADERCGTVLMMSAWGRFSTNDTGSSCGHSEQNSQSSTLTQRLTFHFASALLPPSKGILTKFSGATDFLSFIDSM